MEQETKTTPAVETWRPVKGYEGIYEVSDLARVRSLDRVSNCKDKNGDPFTRICKGKMMKQRITNKGYMTVPLCKDGVKKNCFVHRLVAEAFVPNPEYLPQVNHKDENPKNNMPDNLEWCTAYYNMNYKDERVRSVLKRNTRKGKTMKELTLKQRIEKLQFVIKLLRELMDEDPKLNLRVTIEQAEDKLREAYKAAKWHCVSIIENGTATDVVFEGTLEACQEYTSIWIEAHPEDKGKFIITPY